MFRRFLVSTLALPLVIAMTHRAEAIPVFAHRYNLTCQACHTVVPHLSPFGETFLANGYRIPGVRPRGAFPVAVRIEIDYASGDAADPDKSKGPLPKTIVDEVELLAGGSIGDRGSYWVEPYFIDGGYPGNVREAWIAERLTRDGARIPIVFRAGQFTLPLPLDPETFRETTQPYAIWSQSAGANPFAFFDPKIGGQFAIGNAARSIGGTISLLKGADVQSGLHAQGTDMMETLERDFGDVRLTAYRYDGVRPVVGYGDNTSQFFTEIGDRFWRNGFGIGWSHNTTAIDGVYQIGNDSAADVYHDALVSSGGFLQVRQALGKRAFAIARWDATNGASFGRSYTAGFGYGLTRNSRLTVFETGQRDFQGNLIHIISSSLLFAY